jgi:hypothetical protein
MNNYNQVLEAEGIATNSAGLAQQKYQVYLDSLEASMSRLSDAGNKFWQTTISSGAIKMVVDLGTGILTLATNMGGLVPIVITLAGALVLLNLTTVTTGINGLVTGIANAVTGIVEFVSKIIIADDAMEVFGVTSAAAWGAATLGISLLVGGIIAVVSNLKSLDSQIDATNQSLNEIATNIQTTQGNITSLRDSIDTINGLADAFDNLKGKTNLSAEQQKQWTDLQNQLKQTVPDLAGHYDSLGNFIIADTVSIKNMTAALQAQIVAQEKLMADQEKQQKDQQNTQIAQYQQQLNDLINKRNQLQQGGAEGNSFKFFDPAQVASLNQQIAQAAQDLRDAQIAAGVFTGKIDTMGEAAKSAAEQIANWQTQINNASAAADTNQVSVDKMLTAVNDAVTSYQKSGQVTGDQIIALKGVSDGTTDFTTSLIFNTNSVGLNVDAIRQQQKAYIDAKIASDMEAISALENANATSAETESLWNQIAALREAENQLTLTSVATGGASSATSDYDTVLKATEDMLKQEAQNKETNLQNELNGYKQIIDAKKAILDADKTQYDYENTIADKNKAITDDETQLLALQFDNSQEATAAKLKLKADEAAKTKDLNKTEYDKSIDDQKTALDNDYTNFSNAINKKIDAIKDYLSKTGLIEQQALALLASNEAGFWNNLIGYVKDYGTQLQLAAVLRQEALGGGGGSSSTSSGMSLAQQQFNAAAASEMAQNHGATGLDTVVPQGYPNDNYLVGVSSGERVIVVPKVPQASFNSSGFSNLSSATIAGGGGGVGDISVNFNVSGNLDSTVVPQIKQIANQVINEINKTMVSRGYIRSANQTIS